jgi:hypothetical protein
MTIRITKTRLAAAGLFVLAGIGLGSLLSPLIGTALATVGQTVNISDHSASPDFAKVDSTGALKTVGTVSGGNISISAPQSAFYFAARTVTDAGAQVHIPPTKATLAFTGFRIANETPNSTPNSTTVDIYELGELSTSCDFGTGAIRFLGSFAVLAGDTVDEQLTTPVIVKPLSGHPYWCLVVYANGFADGSGSGNPFYITYSGYAASGTFSPPVTPAKAPPGSAANRSRRR